MRKKIFGMIAAPLDRNAKARLLHRARALMRATDPGKHYGAVTAKAYAVFAALLMQFHNSGTGRCFPAYKAISAAVGCSPRTVAMSIAALEAAGLLSVCNRLLRVRWRDEASRAWRVRVMRTSNCYTFPSEAKKAEISAFSSDGKLCSGTSNQVSNPSLFAALDRLRRGAFEGAKSKNWAAAEL